MILLLLLVVVVICLVVFGLYYWLHGRFYESTDDAYVTSNLVQITPQVAGTVTITIAADGGDYVKQGQLMVRLYPRDIIPWHREAPRPIFPEWCTRCAGCTVTWINYKAIVATRKVELPRAGGIVPGL